jgi:cell division protein FtsW (lipid II flippase)
MGVSYTTAADRDAVRGRRRLTRPQGLDFVLAAASLLAIALIAMAYTGRLRSAPPALASAIDLNGVADARVLEPVFQTVFERPADARLAARELFGFLRKADGAVRSIANVGAISRVRVPAGAIDRASGATAYRQRLADDRARAAAAGKAPPESVALVTGADLAAIKPLVVVRSRAAVRRALLLWGALYIAAFHLVAFLWRRRGLPGDRVLLAIAHALTAVGFAIMVSRADPLRDVTLFVRYAQGILAGLAAVAAISILSVRSALLRHFSYLPLAGAMLLSIALILFGSGPSGSTAKVNLGPLQPIEAIRILLALFLAGYFARHWEVLRAVAETSVGGVSVPRWLNVPRLRYAVPVMIGIGAALALFFLQRDLGPALMLAVVFLAVYGTARGTVGLMLAGAAVLAAGFYLGYRLEVSTTLADRVRMWQSPWDNAARGGDQIAQALWAFATGGPTGAGLGLGDTRYLPAGHTDLVLAAVGEDLGAIGVLAVALLYAALIWRALGTTRRAATDYGFFLGLILTLFFAVPVLLMAAGILGVVPLTGVVTPFLSFGGSAMVANFAALGLLAALRSDPAPAADLAVFRPALRWLSVTVTAAAIALFAVAMRVQLVDADAVAIRPHLGLQGDGSRRYQYNQRVLDLVRLIPRGSILDRGGLPLATDDPALLTTAAPDYARLGISLKAVCPGAGERCYPLGGRAFHLLGDSTTRRNWSATNTSFVERDSESKLRGFDDHQTPVRVTTGGGPGGDEAWTVRRDYRDLLPALRHRRDPDHPAMRALLARPRSLQLTVDARLQLRVAAIVARQAAASKSGRAAAIVLDPDTGDVLASVSYPWPAGQAHEGPAVDETEALLDRARYGLYPPGSTFKLVTAAAALLRNPAADHTTFVCTRLPDGRVGARLNGYPRPIRDDVKDTTPHGSVDMHHGLVVSCNAYFAQLAASLGPGPLIAAADRAEVGLARNNAVARVRDTLPQIGYGQGDVVASPLRMARVAAAIAADGTMRDARIDPAVTAASHEFLPVEAARRLGGFMRDVVLSGTGRSLRGLPIAIAGKTGTAEITGAPSHAWFVGFAPYGPATTRIAVAVVLENAGYGGTAAAPVAGEIVSAAAALGVIR